MIAGDGQQRLSPSRARSARPLPLLSMVLIIATAGLVYELAMATVASYVLGDSVTQFSIVIGLYLSALGAGAYSSRFVTERLELAFVDVELSAALLGGFSAPALLLAFDHTSYFRPILYGAVLVVGMLVGLELPLLMRILERKLAFKDLIAKALTFDYAGALLGSLAFSLWLVPKLGLVHTSLVCGLLNAGVGLASTWMLESEDRALNRRLAAARLRGLAVLVALLLGLLQAGHLVERSELGAYGGKIHVAEHSRYQRIVLAERSGALELYLNGNLQFSSLDERRYHEALVHPAMSSAARRGRVLIGGGGDGLALREVLKWHDVKRVVLVDLDARVTELGLNQPELSKLNERALGDRRVSIVNQDAMTWFASSSDVFDVVLLDFPDPTNYALGKLYSQRFYRSVRARLAEDGALAVQATSPLFARRAFWCIERTLNAAGFAVRPYHVFVPSFGDWGFLLAKRQPFEPRLDALPPNLSFASQATLSAAFVFPSDMGKVASQVNQLNNQALVAYYLADWQRWN